jgi:hypothetical protein
MIEENRIKGGKKNKNKKWRRKNGTIREGEHYKMVGGRNRKEGVNEEKDAYIERKIKEITPECRNKRERKSRDERRRNNARRLENIGQKFY